MKKMELSEAIRILTLVANNPDYGTRGAWEDQDIAAKTVLKELTRLQKENRKLQKGLTDKEDPK